MLHNRVAGDFLPQPTQHGSAQVLPLMSTSEAGTAVEEPSVQHLVSPLWFHFSDTS